MIRGIWVKLVMAFSTLTCGLTGAVVTSIKPGSFLERLSQSGKSTHERLTRLYMAGLARQPTKREVNLAGELYRARGGKEIKMMQDMWWAILNSNEFIFNH